jgi:GNAT superfamily N-acetyltransferase
MRKEYIKSLANESCIYFVKLKGETVGTFELKNKSELATFGVLTKYQRKGIGSAVIQLLIEMVGDVIILGSTAKSRGLYAKFPQCVVSL